MNVAIGLVVVIAVNLSAIRLRRSEPDLRRPFRIPLFPLPPLIAIGLNPALLAALTYEDPVHSLAGLFALVIIAAAYFVMGRRPQAQNA